MKNFLVKFLGEIKRYDDFGRRIGGSFDDCETEEEQDLFLRELAGAFLGCECGIDSENEILKCWDWCVVPENFPENVVYIVAGSEELFFYERVGEA
jgi:hypothetical protein